MRQYDFIVMPILLAILVVSLLCLVANVFADKNEWVDIRTRQESQVQR